ncbi:MAG: hypothetical protein RLO17_02365 [Cyclobacteriaceae bacterium]
MKRFHLILLSHILSLFLVPSVFSKPVVSVTGINNLEEIKALTESFLEHLEVYEDLHLLIVLTLKMSDQFDGATFSTTPTESGTGMSIRVNINAHLSKEEQIHVLAHEMIHVKQLAKNELILQADNGVIWKGVPCKYSGFYNPNSPWEKEAFKYDSMLVDQVRSSQSKKEPC